MTSCDVLRCAVLCCLCLFLSLWFCFCFFPSSSSPSPPLLLSLLSLLFSSLSDFVALSLCLSPVPVYWGDPCVESYNYGPSPHSFIHMRDFADAEDLAQYLNCLVAHPEEYYAYFEWKKHPTPPDYEAKRRMTHMNVHCRSLSTFPCSYLVFSYFGIVSLILEFVGLWHEKNIL